MKTGKGEVKGRTTAFCRPMGDMLDVVIVGGGPAGFTAGLYAGRAGLKSVIVDNGAGGQLFGSSIVENYPGFVEPISGQSLSQLMQDQALKFGCPVEYDQVEGIVLDGKVKLVKGINKTYNTKTVIIATGASARKLGVPGEQEFQGRGVSYCATCDGAFFKDKPIIVVGGGDSALEEALFLCRYGSKVTVVHRRQHLRATFHIQELARKNDKLFLQLNTVVDAIEGTDVVERVRLKDVVSEEITYQEAAGVFMYVGQEPNSSLVKELITLDEYGYIVADADTTQTNVPGIFAAGDVRQKTLRQVVTATSDGAIAAMAASRYVEQNW
ncbi:MAG: thioredoxin-disulfide reductase [Limnochordia bacterium]|jgi:thioredoxin reductase (NADPH)|nr:thioredoxin-disulfide reductase [Limnochordia bacterium]